MLNCKICKKIFSNLNSLSTHLTKIHPLESKEDYYLKYINNKSDKCKICNKKLKFLNFYKGYNVYCSNFCKYNDVDFVKERTKNTKNTLLNKYNVENISQIDDVKSKKKNKSLIKYGVDCVLSSKEIQEQIKKTNLEKYGVNNPLSNKDIQEKIKKTNLERYGFENPSKNKDVYEKIKITNIKKYNNTSYTKTKEFKEKVEETNFKKYNVKQILQSKDIQERIKKTNLERYGFEIPTRNEKVKEKRKKTNLERYGFENASKSEIVKIKSATKNKINFFNNLFNSNRLKNKVIPLFNLEDYNGVDSKNIYKFQCKTCNNIFKDHLDNARIPRCLICDPYPYTSKYETEIVEYIKTLNENINVIQSDRNLIYPYELDIFLPNHKLAIEFNGLYWHSELNGKDKNYHLNKTNLCKEKNIQLIHIYEDEWINKPDIIKSIIKNKLGLNDNKIYARKCIIKEINKNEYKSFLNNNHIQGYVNSKINYGLYYNDELVSLLTLNQSRFNKNYDWEILRFCNILNTSVIGGFSKLLNHFNKNNLGSVITYADIRYSNGGVYVNNGFKYLHTSKPNYYYTDSSYKIRFSRQKFQKHKLYNILENYYPEFSEWDNMKLNGWDRIWDCGNNVYVYTTTI